ncbi:MAG: ATP-binding cassette domain-containing protein [Pseudomonadota bacterium]
MIEFENVSKSFWTGKSRKVILDQASFRIELGRSLGILAPNGTGKTTIINMMAGLEHADEGRIVRTSRVSFPLGVVGGINNKQSAQENTRFIARLYGLEPDDVEAFCRYLCDIKEYFEMPVATYSQGMRSRFMFALMLSLDFDIYLIDEGMPSTIDAEFNRKAGAILHERLSQATVVIVSHRPRILETYCEAAAVLRHGRLYMFDTLDDAKELYDYTV